MSRHEPQGVRELHLGLASFLIRGQGATEYLVLLAVVLVIALVAIALLGFFPGMASDAQKAQSEAYWKSAAPIAIYEKSLAYYYSSGHGNATLFRVSIRNTGPYPITVTKLLGGDNYSAVIQSQGIPITLAQGEENCIGGGSNLPVLNCLKYTWFQTPTTPTDYSGDVMRGADSICSPNGKGRLVIRNFGFEYVVNIEGKTLTKRQIGKTIYADCSQGVS